MERRPTRSGNNHLTMRFSVFKSNHFSICLVSVAAVLVCSDFSIADDQKDLPSSIYESFNDLPSGGYSKSRLTDKWKSIAWSYTERADVVSNTDFQRATKGKALRVTYPAGKISSKESGASFVSRLSPNSVYYLDYYVRFGHGNGTHWQFSKGGKLPGLGGGTCSSGGDRATGDGWSCRYMWRENGKLILYLYHMDQKSNYGDIIDLKTKLIPGKWHRLTQRVEVNTNNKPNGKIKIWVDGQLKLDKTDVRLRKGNLAPVDHFLFETFYGGSTKKWAPKIDTLAYFDNIRIQQNPIPDLEMSK